MEVIEKSAEQKLAEERAEGLFFASLNEKAEVIGKRLGVKVTPIAFKDQNDVTQYVVGYLKEPNRMTKLRVMDKSINAAYTASAEMLEACIIREESDPRIMSELPENDTYYLGAVNEAMNLTMQSINQFKKK